MISVEHRDKVIGTFIMFVQTAQAVLKYINAQLYKKAGLSVVKLIVLQALDRNHGMMNPSNIAEWTYTERHNITALVSRMKREGLIVATRDNTNKRLVNVALTDKGRQLLDQAMTCPQWRYHLLSRNLTQNSLRSWRPVSQ